MTFFLVDFEKKLKEVRKACAVLGITDIRTLDRDDDMEILAQEMVIEIGEQIREVRPDMLITHHPYEDGGDRYHAGVGQAVLYAFRYACGCWRRWKMVIMVRWPAFPAWSNSRVFPLGTNHGITGSIRTFINDRRNES